MAELSADSVRIETSDHVQSQRFLNMVKICSDNGYALFRRGEPSAKTFCRYAFRGLEAFLTMLVATEMAGRHLLLAGWQQFVFKDLSRTGSAKVQ